MSKHPLQKYVKHTGYGDDNFLHNVSFYEETNPAILHEASWNDRYYPQKPLYKHVVPYRKLRFLIGKTDGDANFLNVIAGEIELRGKILKQEFYFIGELLCLARHILKINRPQIQLSFKDWVENNFDFSYSTALNLCRVHLVCAGNIQNVRYIRLSVLYKICSKNFPEQLRDYLFNSGKLYHMNLNTLGKVYHTYVEECRGIEQFEEKVEKILDVYLQREEYLISMHELDEAIETLITKINSFQFIKKKKDYVKKNIAPPLGDRVSKILFDNLTKCLELMLNERQYLTLYYNNLPKIEPTFSKYHQFELAAFKIEHNPKISEYSYNKKNNTVYIPK